MDSVLKRDREMKKSSILLNYVTTFCGIPSGLELEGIKTEGFVFL